MASLLVPRASRAVGGLVITLPPRALAPGPHRVRAPRLSVRGGQLTCPGRPALCVRSPHHAGAETEPPWEAQPRPQGTTTEVESGLPCPQETACKAQPGSACLAGIRDRAPPAPGYACATRALPEGTGDHKGTPPPDPLHTSHSGTHTCTHTHVHSHACTRMHTYPHMCIHPTRVYIHSGIRVHTHMRAYSRVHAHSHAQ